MKIELTFGEERKQVLHLNVECTRPHLQKDTRVLLSWSMHTSVLLLAGVHGRCLGAVHGVFWDHLVEIQ